MEGTFTTTDQDLLIAAIVVLLGLVAFVSSIYLTKKSREGGAQFETQDGAEGTVLVEENGVAVRRSTRFACMSPVLRLRKRLADPR
jgi:hypothetical protein